MKTTKEIFDALLFASEKHRKHKRKDLDQTPYINHPIKVAGLLLNTGGVEDPVLIKAALLHDTIEDTDATEEELRRKFGNEVTDIVLEVTDDKSLAKEERKFLQIENAPKKSKSAKILKLADKIANLEDILNSPPKDWDNKRKLEYFKWAEEVFEGLKDNNSSLEARLTELIKTGKQRYSD